jgi:predicted dinucleotide-binding enzyme
MDGKPMGTAVRVGDREIGIIGAGNNGGTLTRRLAALGHEVFVANSRGPETLRDLAAETGATAVSVTDAARNKDVVIIITEKNILDLPDDLFAGTGDVVVDTGNYYPQQRDGRIEAIDDGMVESRWVEQQLGRPVIKGFNNIYADHLRDSGRPAGTPGRIALPVAGDDESAKAVVMQLIDELGFDAVDAESLDQSWAPAARHPRLHHRPRRGRRAKPPVGGKPGARTPVARYAPTAPEVSSTHGNAQPQAATIAA